MFAHRFAVGILIALALPAFAAESPNDPGPAPSWKEPIDFVKKTFSSVFGVAGKVGKKATGLVSGVFDIGPKNPDGTPRKLLDVSRMRDLGWTARIPLETGLNETWHWYRSQGGA